MQTINLNLIPTGVRPVLHCSQYDIGREFGANIYDGDEEYTIPTGASVIVQGTKPDGHSFIYGADDGVTFSGNAVSFTTTEQMAACAGDTECEIKIMASGATLCTLNFVLDVERSALPDDADISKSDLSLIQKAADAGDKIDALSDKIDKAEELIQEVEGNVKSAETSAANAKASETNAAASASSASTSASAAATSATNAANSATAAKNSQSSASGYATQAKNSATAAANSATAAATSASTASAKADDASASAAAAAKSAQEAAGAVAGVATWNGRAGTVKPQSGDYTADMVGAMPVDRAATASVLGGVKVGSNITVSSGTISVTKSNVTSALGYTPPTTNTTYNNATTSAAGLMSASDKSKLDGIDAGANKITVDEALSSSSTNPVQNKVINTALGNKADVSTVTSLSSRVTECESDIEAIGTEVAARPSTRKLSTQTLTASGGTLTWTDDAIGDDSLIDVYASIPNIAPSEITQNGTTVTVTFDAQDSEFSVALVVMN